MSDIKSPKSKTQPKKLMEINSCRICLSGKKPLCPLFRYKLSGNYAEMLTSIADVKVASNDGLPDKICAKCCIALEKAFLLKTVAERSDKELHRKLEKLQIPISTKKIAFDSLTDIKSEIGPLTVKAEPKWEMEVEVLGQDYVPPSSTNNLNDIMIANTVIRKVDPNAKENQIHFDNKDDTPDVTWKSSETKPISSDDDYTEDFLNDDDDEDYVPLNKIKNKFKKPKLSEIKVFKEKKSPIKKSKISEIIQFEEEEEKPGQLITCYPIMKNGCRGPPILLRRPKDATILKVHPNYKKKTIRTMSMPKSISLRDKTTRIVKRKPREVTETKQKEKLVCPICGILTFTLGNHMTTHQEKKRYSCPQCPRTFAQKGNLEVHAKQHLGIKDHICEVCGAGFYSQKSLIRHNLIHKGDRPFACNQCSRRFIARCDLNRHLKIHSGYKPYKCSTCTMSFNAKHQLNNHERMHTGERPYTCQVCNVAFSYKVNLNNHVLKIHGINLKYKSIHTVTEDVLLKEHEMMPNNALLHLVPPPAAHETVHYSIE